MKKNGSSSSPGAPGSASLISRFYEFLLDHRWKTLVCLLLVVVVTGYFARLLQIDTSSETLMNESDEALRYSRIINSRYNIQDFLIIAYSPHKDLLSDEVLDDIAALKEKLLALEPVSRVTTLLDVPLLESPPLPLQDLASDSLPTLRSAGVDLDLARQELLTSPIYSNMLVSPDLATTAIQIDIKINEYYRDIVAERDHLADQAKTGELTAEEEKRLDFLENQILKERKAFKERDEKMIADIRAIMDQHRHRADLFLGGLTMISNDLIRFIKNDLKVFGLGVFFLLVVMLGLIFQRLRWIMLPLLCCAVSAVVMMGLLGLFEWKVTVISSNFISLQLIITMAISIHLVVRYRELLAETPHKNHRRLIVETMQLKLIPCLYAGLTTMAGFASLILSDIQPVVTFGWMMVGGIVVSLLMTFFLFPVLLSLFSKTDPPAAGGGGRRLTRLLAAFTQSHGRLIIIISAFVLVISAMGISRLTVENAFINYFKKTTEIYQGLRVIDRQLGGTTPLDVLIDFSDQKAAAGEIPDSPPAAVGNKAEPDDFDFFDEFEDDGVQEEHYWFTPYKMDKIMAVHDYLDSLPATGKVVSLGTMLKTALRLTGGRPLDSLELPLIYNELPEEYRRQLIDPYVSVEHDQARLSVRVVDTFESLRRDQLLDTIYHDLTENLGYDDKQVNLTGMLVLYNNVLQQLFESQILTLGVVLVALMIMFLALFRSLKIAVIAVFPNLLSIAVVLGVIGWLNIPLDMMTITIAAISVGIAVDDTIHYIHRFKKEFLVSGDYIKAMHRSHGSVGYAMYYTSITIIMGFSILALSNFIPTIVFGLLTGLAMLIALLAAMTLLPQLILMVKPFGEERGSGTGMGSAG